MDQLESRPAFEPITEAMPVGYADWPGSGHMTSTCGARPSSTSSQSLGLGAGEGSFSKGLSRRIPQVKPTVVYCKGDGFFNLRVYFFSPLSLSCPKAAIVCQTQRKVTSSSLVTRWTEATQGPCTQWLLGKGPRVERSCHCSVSSPRTPGFCLAQI